MLRLQPFYSTDCLSNMIEEVEAVLQLPRGAPSAPAGAAAAAADAVTAPAAAAAAASAAPVAATVAGDSPLASSAPDSLVRRPCVPAASVYSPGRSRASQADVLKRTQAALSMWQVHLEACRRLVSNSAVRSAVS